MRRLIVALGLLADYATSGRLYINFTNPSGHTVVARFRRASGNSRQADASSRFDLRWPDGRTVGQTAVGAVVVIDTPFAGPVRARSRASSTAIGS